MTGDRRPTTGPLADVLAYLADQDATLVSEDRKLRAGEDDVHAVRVATRRIRSTLRIFGKLFEPAPAQHLADELSWYADLLGEVRDRQVQRQRFADRLADLPDEWVLGPVAATIEQRLLSEQLRVAAALHDAMDSERYRALLRTSAEFHLDPPFSDAAREKGRKLVLKAIDRAGRKARRRLDEALRSDRSDDELLHRARKAAKRARYAAESSSTKGRGHRKAAKRFKKLQGILGDHQDAVVAADLLRSLGAATHDDPGQNGFTFGLLHQQEIDVADTSRRAAARWHSKS